jgi:hypothetical protein
MSKFDEVVKKNEGYFVGGKVGLRNELLLHLMAKKGIICIHSVDGG